MNRTPRLMRLMLTICTVFCLGGPFAFASSAQPTDAMNAPADTWFTYQGQLAYRGELVNEICIFEFKLYAAARGGNQIGETLSIEDLEVVNGLFAVDLDFGKRIFGDETRWLETTVNGAVLSPRQAVVLHVRRDDTGHANDTRDDQGGDAGDVGKNDQEADGVGDAHAIGAGSGSGDSRSFRADDRLARGGPGQGQADVGGAGDDQSDSHLIGLGAQGGPLQGWVIFVNGVYYNDGNVGIGTDSPGHKLTVRSHSKRTISAINTKLNGDAIGIRGQSSSRSGKGVVGFGSAAEGFNFGVWGRSNSSSGAGVYGLAQSTLGTTYGVFGDVKSATGYAGYFLGGRNYFEGDVGIGNNAPDGKLEVRQSAAADIFNLYDDLTNVFTVLDGGNVGIGAATPGERLDVAGNIAVTGTVDGLDISDHGADANAHHTPPIALPPSGSAGGDLSGTYPNPSVVDDSHLHADATVADLLSVDNGRLFAPTGAGNVGIGTVTPGQRLDVAGNIAVTGTVDGLDISDHGADANAHHTPPIALPPSGPAGGDLSGTFPNPSVVDDSHIHGDATVSNTLSINNGRLFAPAGAGNVGIGTVTPGQRLDVAGNIAVTGTVDGLDISDHGADANAHHTPPIALPPSGPAGGDLSGTFPNPSVVDDSHLHADATVADTLSIDNGRLFAPAGAGNVGIGTVSPTAARLVVDNGFSGNLVSRFTTGTGASSAIEIESTAGGTKQWALRTNGPAAGGPGGPSSFNIIEDGYAGTIRMIFRPGGNIGIGRDPAANVLEVEGDASKTVAGSWLANSDARIKTNVRNITDALETLDRVRLVDFRYTDEYLALHPRIENRPYVNVIAQEFMKVFPNHVKGSGERLPNGEEILQVDSYPLTIYSAAAIQELHRIVESRAREIAPLRDELKATNARLADLEALVTQLLAEQK